MTRYDTPRPAVRRLRGRARTRVGLVTAALTVLAGLVLAGPAALAHVSLTPSTAEAGSTAELTFRVPNEEAKAATTSLTVQIPTDQPIAQVLAKPIPGWHVTVHTIRLDQPLVTDDGTFHSVVSQVRWSGGRIDPGQYQDFSLSADPLPDEPTTLVFKALQGYSNGDVVRWIDVEQEGQAEPEHPAPTLTVVKAGASPGSSDSGHDSGHDSTDGSMSDMPDNGSTSEASDGSSEGASGEVVAWIALAVSLVAAGLAAGSFARSRRTP